MFHPLDHPMERGWVGRIEGDHVLHLAAQTLQSFLTGGGSAREHAVYPLAAVRFLAPVLHPPAVRVFDSGGSFEFANPAAIAGPGASVVTDGEPLTLLPRLAAVVGAEGAIAGYTGVADWRRPERTPPKDRDFALGLGPIVVTADALDPDGFDWRAARELAAEGTALRPGDLLVGPAREELEVGPGGVTVEFEGIGVLEQDVVRA